MKRPVLARPLAAVFLAVALLGSARAAVAPGEWPHWRGPSRNGVSPESSGWKGGPWPGSPLWSVNVGEGSSSVIVTGGKVYAIGWAGNQDHVQCLDAATGKTVWKQSYGAPRYGRHATGDQNFYAGASATPEFDPATGFLYTVSADGALNCWNTRAGGSRVWGLNLNDRYGLKQRPQATRRPGTRRDYGFTASPLVHGDWLLVEIGSPEHGSLLALNKKTGEQAWLSEHKGAAGHSGGVVPMTVEGVPCAVFLGLPGLVVVRLDGPHAGKTVAEYPWVTDFDTNIPTPAVLGDSVVITSAYNKQAACRVRITLRGAEKVWETRRSATVCSPVIFKGHVYFAERGLACLDWATGEVKWHDGRFGEASSVLATADNRLIVWSNDGDLGLVESAQASPNDYKELAFKRGLGRAEAWPHVVLAGGRLYLKDRAGNLSCVPVAGP